MIYEYTSHILMARLGTMEIILIVLAVLLLFGDKKIPALMKSLGKGIRSFKEGVNGLTDDISLNEKKEETDKE